MNYEASPEDLVSAKAYLSYRKTEKGLHACQDADAHELFKAGWNARLPKEPTPGLLMSIALRLDHGLGIPGYYDSGIAATPGVTHADRLRVALVDARRAWEEITGRGFYSPEKEAEYSALADRASK